MDLHRAKVPAWAKSRRVGNQKHIIGRERLGNTSRCARKYAPLRFARRVHRTKKKGKKENEMGQSDLCYRRRRKRERRVESFWAVEKKRIYDYLEEFSNSSSLAFSLTWSLFELDWLQRMQWMCVILINMSEQLNKYENNAIYHVSYCLQGRFSNSITLSMSPKWFTYNNCQRCIRRSL